MLKTSLSGVARRVLIRWAPGVLVIVGIGLLGPGHLAVTPVIAQDHSSPLGAAPSRPTGAGIAIDGREDDTDTASGAEGKSGTSRGDSSESVPGWIAHASRPVVIVTLVIAVMSFYLIALVVWMALHYRTPAAVPPELVRDVQDLLDQTKYQRGLSPARGGFVVPGAGAGRRRAQAAGGAGLRRSGPWSWPTKT